jgi:NAD(P)-dependent dehydrogenase (short-subunit alcohol dehydrogenase family)
VRSALVTGGSSGIGLAIATMLAEEGFALTLAARGRDGLDRAAADLSTPVTWIAGDLRTEDAVAAAVAHHGDEYGRLDVLVSNAGVGAGQYVEELTARRIDLQLDLNLRTTMLLYREAAPLLRATAAQEGRALVVTITSTAARGVPWLSVYGAAKAGVIAFTRSMIQELGPDGVHSCAVIPGTVDTPLVASADRAELLPPSDIAEVVRMLLRLSPQAVVPEVVVEPRGEARRQAPR